MSALSDKINSYSLERGISFNEPFTLTPVRTGSNPLGTFTKNTGTTPIYETGTGYGPVGGNGSWNMAISTTTANNGYIRETAASGDELLDLGTDYSVGFWFKINSLPTGTSATALQILSVGTTTQCGFVVYISGSSNASNPSQIRIGFGSSGSRFINETIVGGTWYYLAVRRGGANSNDMEFYLNGTLVSTGTHSSTTAPTSLTFGNTSAGVVNGSWNFSDYYVATRDAVNTTAIAEIWNVGSTGGGTNVSIAETPATASALQTEPTIAVTAGDHTEITTSIPVSALFPEATANTQKFINVVADVATADADVVNNVIVGGSNSESFSAEPFLASAEMTEAIVSRPAMTASATSGNHTASVGQSYYSLVTSENPFLYIYDGQLSPVNAGFRSHTFSRGSSAFGVNVDSIGQLAYVGERKSWRWTASATNDATFNIVADTYNNSFPAHMAQSSYGFTIEFWFNSSDTGYAQLMSFGGTTAPILTIEVTANKMNYGVSTINSGINNYFGGNTTVLANTWNHLVITGSKLPGFDIQYQTWLNGSLDRAFTVDYLIERTLSNLVQVGSRKSTQSPAVYESVYVDEIVFYDKLLSNSAIQNHYSFVSAFGPNRTVYSEVLNANATFGSHNFTVQQNVNYPQNSALCSALIVQPTVLAGRSFTHNDEAITASALVADPQLSLGTRYVASALIAYAELKESYTLNSIYYDYVQDNIAPYRYVTFDAQSVYEDYGTDVYYSVVPTTVGGTIVNPDEGINGKSAKTAGTNYSSDGVILKESEWNDSWGTGSHDWHSAFWFQRALDDNSTTGLRVLWNLNGYKDNQHAVLYQYQGKLHMQFNNGSGTFTETDSTALDLFDYNRHFVVIDHNHGGGNNNTVKLYVDSILRFTVNIGSITPTTTNAITADSGANNEENNHSRLSIGCLITPFGSTALPVIPANTKLIIDEVYWDKNSINQTQVTNLYNAMPEKGNSIFTATAITATAQIVQATYSTTVNHVATPATASLDAPDSGLIVYRNIVNAASPLTASAQLVDALRLDNVIITSDIMVATVIFNDAGTKMTIPGGPMIADATLANRYPVGILQAGVGIQITTNTSTVAILPANLVSPWAAWLRATEVSSIYPTREVV